MPNTNANTKAVTEANYNGARSNFKDHYFLAQCNSSFGGQDIQISWDDFAGAVNDFIGSNKVDPMDVALRFVHCFDTQSNDLYLRLQICTMTLQENSNNVYDLVTTPCAWYEIGKEGISPTTNTKLDDTAYLENLYYCNASPCSAASSTRLIDDGGTQFARNLVFPWGMQLTDLYADNSSPEGANICFGASSFTNQGSGAAYQHGLVIYLRDVNGVALLNNVVTGSIYDCKGADMATLCPPCCNVYVS